MAHLPWATGPQAVRKPLYPTLARELTCRTTRLRNLPRVDPTLPSTLAVSLHSVSRLHRLLLLSLLMTLGAGLGNVPRMLLLASRGGALEAMKR